MTRLLDDIRNGGTLNAPRVVAKSHLHAWMKYASSLHPFLKEPDLICQIPGVATYYFETTRQEFWNLGKRDHFPDLTPPRQVIWFEYPFPAHINSEIAGVQDLASLCPDGRAGVLLMKIAPANAVGEGIPALAKWILQADVFVDYGEKGQGIHGPHCPHFIAIDEAGAIVGELTMQAFTGPNDDKRTEAVRNLIGWIHPALLALSWLPRELPDDMKEIKL